MNAFIESTLKLMRRGLAHPLSADEDGLDFDANDLLSLGGWRGGRPAGGEPPPMHADELAEVEAEVRAHVVARMASRGITADPHSILLAADRADALRSVIAAVGVDPNGPIAVENPTSPAVVAALGGRCIPVDRGAEGLDFAALDRAFQAGARVFYTTATGHDPSGATLSAADRAIVLTLARRHGAWIVDDDGNGDLAYAPTPPPLLGLGGADDRVVHVGGHASALAPLPTGAWLVMPHREGGEPWHQAAKDRIHAAHAWDRFFRRFGVEAFEARIGPALQAMRARRDALLSALEVYVGDAATWIAPQAGVSLLLRPTEPVSSRALAAESLRHGVVVEPAARCFVGGDDGGALLLSFANLDCSRMGTAIWRLAGALDTIRGR